MTIAKQWATYLTDLLLADPLLATELIETRYQVRQLPENFPFVSFVEAGADSFLGKDSERWGGVLGLINGFLLATEGPDADFVIAHYDDGNVDVVTGFSVSRRGK